MTYVEFAALCRFYTQTSSVTFSDSDLVLLANNARDEITSEAANRANHDEFCVPATTNLVADQREYALPVDKLNSIKYVEANLQVSAGQDNWVKLNEFDIVQYQRPTNETETVSRFSNNEGAAFFDIFRNSLYLYCGTIINVTDGLKLWYQAYLRKLTTADLASTTDMAVDRSTTEIGLPTIFHELVARRVSIAWKSSRDKPVPESPLERQYPMDLEKRIREYTEYNLDTSFKATMPFDDGFDY